MKVLLVKLKHIGDTLLLTPTLHHLRRAYPDAQIDVVVRRGCESILAGNSDISNIFTTAPPEKSPINRRAWWLEQKRIFGQVVNQRYDYAFDLSNSDRAKLLVLLSRARIRGINDAANDVGWKRCFFNRFAQFDWRPGHQVLKDFRTVSEIMELPGEPGPMVIAWEENTAALFAKIQFPGAAKPYVVIHPTSRWAFKQWFPERWAKVADHLAAQGLNVIFSCGPDAREREYVDGILRLAQTPHHATQGRLSLRELAGLIRQSRLFLGVDTVAMHIAAAVQTPIVTLFGKQKPQAWGPWQCPHTVIAGECACRAAKKFTCSREQPYKCMETISEAAVIQAAKAMLNNGVR